MFMQAEALQTTTNDTAHVHIPPCPICQSTTAFHYTTKHPKQAVQHTSYASAVSCNCKAAAARAISYGVGTPKTAKP